MSWYSSLTISHFTFFFNICAHLNRSLILEVAKFKCHVFLFAKHGINLIILLKAQLLLGDPPPMPKNQFMLNWRNDIFFCVLANEGEIIEGTTPFIIRYNVSPWVPPMFRVDLAANLHCQILLISPSDSFVLSR